MAKTPPRARQPHRNFRGTHCVNISKFSSHLKSLVGRLFLAWNLLKFKILTKFLSKEFHKNYVPRLFSEVLPVFPWERVPLNVTSHWSSVVKDLEYALANDDIRILTNPSFQFAFHVTTLNPDIFFSQQVAFCRQHFGGRLEELVKEDNALVPRIVDRSLVTSEALMYHLSHYAAFEKETGASMTNLGIVVEFGGGYGGSTRVLNRLMNTTGTIVVVDLPQMLQLQYYYLSEVGLETRLRICSFDGDLPVQGKINLLPAHFSESLSAISSMKPDLFVATWSLSEAPRETQEFIRELDYFESGQILYGYYNENSSTLPHSTEVEFPSYYTQFKEACFFSSDRKEQYHFLKRNA